MVRPLVCISTRYDIGYGRSAVTGTDNALAPFASIVSLVCSTSLVASRKSREALFGFYGPLSLLVLVGVWAVGLVFSAIAFSSLASGTRQLSIFPYHATPEFPNSAMLRISMRLT